LDSVSALRVQFDHRGFLVRVDERLN
jgi:hypothetical protein